MGHLNILKRAWHIVWQYRVLWIFGILLALTITGTSTGNQNVWTNSSDKHVPQEFQFEPPAEWRDFQEKDWEEFWEDFEYEFEREMDQYVPPGVVGLLVVLGIALALIGFVLFIIGRVVRYVAEVAVIRMVNNYEDTGEKLRFREGWRLGWSQATWKSFLINLVITLPVALLFIILLLIGLSPLLMWAGGRTVAGVLGTISSIGMSFLFIFFGAIVMAVLRLLKYFFFRVCALEDAGVRESIKQGYALVRHNLKDVGLMWLVIVGLNILWRIVKIPVVLLLLAISALIGGGFLLVTRLVTGIVLQEAAAWVLGGLVGGPIFLILFVLPLLFLEGWRLLYTSSVWTLSYRELNALDSLDTLPEMGSDTVLDVIDADVIIPADAEDMSDAIADAVQKQSDKSEL